MAECVKYSVIIPVYNAENTIERCLDSLLNQIPAFTELLVVNDDSKDGSGEICKKYAEKYPFVRYFEKENGGVSSARNLALDYAKGEYILFADSDDYVSPDYWRMIDTLLNEHHPDMLQFGFRNCGETVKELNTGDYCVNGDIDVAVKINSAMRLYMFSALYARTFKRELIQKHSLRFKTNLAVGEDQEFIFAYAMHMSSLVSSSATLYNVVLENSESLSRKRRDYLVEQLLEVNFDMFDALEKAAFTDDVRQIYRGSVVWVHYRSVYSACKELLKYDLTSKERRYRIKEICRIYNAKRIKPRGLKCRIIAFPVIHKMSRIIDALICRAS